MATAMDKALLMFRGGVRSAVRKFADGQEHTLHYLAKTPDEIAVFLGAQSRFSNDEAGDLGRQKSRAKFIASSLCDESGTPLMTDAEAALIPATFKPELCEMIITGSSEVGELGNG